MEDLLKQKVLQKNAEFSFSRNTTLSWKNLRDWDQKSDFSGPANRVAFTIPEKKHFFVSSLQFPHVFYF